MKVAFFSPTIDPKVGWGNFATELLSSYYNFYSKDIECVLYLPKSEQNKDYIASAPFADSISFSLPEFTHSFIKPNRLYRYLSTTLEGDGFDMIHCSDFPYAVVGLGISMRQSIPLIITLHGTFYKPVRKILDPYIYKKTYNKASKIIGPSEFTCEQARQQFNLPSEKIEVIHNGVNYDRFSKTVDIKSLEQRYGINKKVIIGVGALKRRKGFDLVVRAMQKVKREIPQAVYIIVGTGSDEENLKSLVQQLHLEDTVFFAGKVSDKELPAYFYFSDVYCHVPRNIGGAFEGFGIVYLEAGATSKPVVGSRSGGVSDAILDNKTGILVPEEDVDATTGALIKILRDDELALRLGENGKKYAYEHRWEKIAGQYIKIYNNFITS